MYVGVHSTQMKQKIMMFSKNRCCWIIPPKKTLLRANIRQKIPQKNPTMGQHYFALLFCIAMLLILKDQALYMQQTEE